MVWTAPGDEPYWYWSCLDSQPGLRGSNPASPPAIQQGAGSPAALVTPKADAKVVHPQGFNLIEGKEEALVRLHGAQQRPLLLVQQQCNHTADVRPPSSGLESVVMP